MLAWSYDYVKQRHTEERAKREADARFFVEKWLETLVGPYLTKREPLPELFVGKLTTLFQEEKFRRDAEVTSMAEKLGWTVQVSAAQVFFLQASRVHVPTIDSKWDVQAVREQKKRNDDERLKDVRAVIAKTVEHYIGKADELPGSFPLEVPSCWVNDNQEDLALLGWTVDRTATHFYLRKA